MKSSAKGFGLTTSQFMIVYEIYNNKGMSLKELSTRLDLPKSSVSRIVDQLVNRGVVIRKIPKENRRKVELSITDDFVKNKNISYINIKMVSAINNYTENGKSQRIINALEELNKLLESEK
jgi:predicted transcriptional regulator